MAICHHSLLSWSSNCWIGILLDSKCSSYCYNWIHISLMGLNNQIVLMFEPTIIVKTKVWLFSIIFIFFFHIIFVHNIHERLFYIVYWHIFRISNPKIVSKQNKKLETNLLKIFKHQIFFPSHLLFIINFG